MVMLKTSRRGLLRGLAGASFAASTMRFLLRSAEAQAYPKRFLFVFTNAGRDSQSRSTGSGPTYALGPGYAPLAPFKAKVSILDGMKIPPHTGEEHPCGKAAALTGRQALAPSWKAAGPSFDRYLAGKLTAGASFFTGTYNGKGSGDVGINPVSWNGANSANDAFLEGSGALLMKLFTGATPPPPPPPPPAGTGGAVTPPPPAGDLDEVALYDYLMADVARLKRFAPRSELDKLELHAQALSQLRAGYAGGGAPPPVPTGTGTTPTTQPPAGVTRVCDASVSLAAAAAEIDKISLVIANAFACDRARIGVVRFGAEDPYHNYSHWQDGASNRTNMQAMDRQWAQNFANLLGYLDSFAEGSGTVLDNTLVVWSHDTCGEYGVNMDSGTPLPGEDNAANGIHNTGYVPFVLAGSLGGTLKTGQRFYLPGRTNVDLYRTVAAQMGVKADDFGDPAYYRGVLQEILA